MHIIVIKYHCHLKVNAFSWHLALKAQPLLFRDAIGIMFASIIIKFSRERASNAFCDATNDVTSNRTFIRYMIIIRS